MNDKRNLQGLEWFDAPGVVYFVQAGSDCESCKSIKIGVTVRNGLLRRLRSLQSSNHTRIRLLRVIEFDQMRGAEDKEGELHIRFADPRKPLKKSVGYEWFKATGELLRTIEEEGTVPQEMVNRPKGFETLLELFT